MFRPMLAPREDPLSYRPYWDNIRYPLLCSPKFDGIRGWTKNGLIYSRTSIPLPSNQVQDLFGNFENLDGEIIEGNPSDLDVYNRTQSHVMSKDKPGDMHYFVFDYITEDDYNKPFYERLEILEHLNYPSNVIHVVTHEHIENKIELLEYEEKILKQGFEAIIMRDPVGPYKRGRGTFLEGYIYKLKRFQDTEGVIVDLTEQKINENVLEEDEQGYAKRSTFKDGMIPANTLGNFVVIFKGKEILVAPGNFNHKQRKEIWENCDNIKGKCLKFRYFAHGMKDKPRFPRAIGFRNEMDI